MCNGWKTRATWLLNVYNFYEDSFKEGQFESVDDLCSAMEDMFEDWYEENLPENPLMRDLIGRDIDFWQLAEAKKEKYVKKAEASE